MREKLSKSFSKLKAKKDRLCQYFEEYETDRFPAGQKQTAKSSICHYNDRKHLGIPEYPIALAFIRQRSETAAFLGEFDEALALAYIETTQDILSCNKAGQSVRQPADDN